MANQTLHENHPWTEKLASFGRDKTTGTFHRLPIEGEMLKAHKGLKEHFDAVDELTEEEMLIEYGYSTLTEDEEGNVTALVRVRANGGIKPDGKPDGRIIDRFRHDGNGDFYYDEFRNGEWVPKMNHAIRVDSAIEGIPPTFQPDMVWPREGIRMVYGHACKVKHARTEGIEVEGETVKKV